MHRSVLVKWRQARHDGNAGEVNTDRLFSPCLSRFLFLFRFPLADAWATVCLPAVDTKLCDTVGIIGRHQSPALTVTDTRIDDEIFMRETIRGGRTRHENRRICLSTFSPSSVLSSHLPSSYMVLLAVCHHSSGSFTHLLWAHASFFPFTFLVCPFSHVSDSTQRCTFYAAPCIACIDLFRNREYFFLSFSFPCLCRHPPTSNRRILYFSQYCIDQTNTAEQTVGLSVLNTQ